MKIFASNIIDITQFQSDHIITIDVNFAEVANSEVLKIAASKHLSNLNKYQVEDKFRTFSMNVLNYIDDRNFIIEEHHASNRAGSLSYYITFYPTDEAGNVRDKYLIFLRLSDHNIKDLSKKSMKYHRDTAKKFKRSSDENQLYSFENIVIDGKRFKGFMSALEYIHSLLEQMEDGSYFE